MKGKIKNTFQEDWPFLAGTNGGQSKSTSDTPSSSVPTDCEFIFETRENWSEIIISHAFTRYVFGLGRLPEKEDLLSSFLFSFWLAEQCGDNGGPDVYCTAVDHSNPEKIVPP